MPTLNGSCHCGAVTWQVDVPDDWQGPSYRCDCSICRRKGILMAAIPQQDFRVTKGEDALQDYRWNSGVARHRFCKTCGIYTHHHRRSDPDTVGINLGCVDDPDFDADALDHIKRHGSTYSTV